MTQPPENEAYIEVSSGEGKFRVILIGIPTKEGVIVCILGGEKPHIGSLVLGIPRPSLKSPTETSVTSSVINIVGHKDDEIARPVAEKFARELQQVTAVIAGVHVDNASEDDITRLMDNSNQAAETLLKKMKRRLSEKSLNHPLQQ